VWSEKRGQDALVAAHAGGEITLQSQTSTPALFRLDAEQSQRWRVALGDFGLNEATPVADGGLLVRQFDELGLSNDVSYLQHIGAGGELSDREYFTGSVKVVEGAPLDGALLTDGTLVRRRLP
jgi:hypothetical protein